MAKKRAPGAGKARQGKNQKHHENNNIEESALRYANAGIPVFPCDQNKRPKVKDWPNVASTDAKQVRSWWKEWPDALIGIPTGLRSGIFVVDLDIKNGTNGVANFQEFGVPDSTVVADTPSGGEHHFYVSPSQGCRNTASKVANGIDTRGEGGYFIAPPSIGLEGAYCWRKSDGEERLLNRALPEVPNLILQRAIKPKHKTPRLITWKNEPNSRWAQKALENESARVSSAPKGERNDTLNRAAFSLGQILGAGLLDRPIVEQSLQHAASQAGLVADETLATIASGIEAGLKEPRGPNSTTKQQPNYGGRQTFHANDPWREPPVPLIRESPPPDPYPADALGPLEPAARAIIDLTQVPDAIAAQSVLAAASLAVQGYVDVETLDGYKPTSLFMISIAESGERKSAADRYALEPIRKREDELRAEYEDEFNQYKRNHTAWTAEHKAIERDLKAKNNNRRIEARADLEALRPEPLPPLLPNLIAADPTLEGLQKLFLEGRPSLGLFSDEGGRFAGGYGMADDNRTKTIAGLCNFWDGSKTDRTRAKDGALVIAGKRLAQHLMFQPVIAQRLLSDELARSQGYLARCLICRPSSTMGKRAHREADPQSTVNLAKYSDRLGSLLRQGLPLREGWRNELAPRQLCLSIDARAVLISYHDTIERELAEEGMLRPIAAFAAKSAEQACRIAAVLEIVDNPEATEIQEKNMIHGTEIAQFHLTEALRLMDAATNNADMTDANKLWRWISKRWNGFAINITAIVRGGPRCARTASSAKKLVEILESFGYLRKLKCGAEIEGQQARIAWAIYGRRP